MLTSIRVIQVYGSSGDQQKKFAETSRAMDIAVQVGQLTAAFGAVISLLQQVVVVVIIWLAVWLGQPGPNLDRHSGAVRRPDPGFV